MIATFPATWPTGAALGPRIVQAMRVILHIGAHRCATTTFQHYLRLNAERLCQQRVGYWGPRRTRSGLFSGLQPGPRAATGRDPRQRAIGRVQMACGRSASAGIAHLVVSDENILGSVRENSRLGTLYLGAGERIARVRAAFDGYISDVVLNVRGLDRYWSSALGYGLTRGRPVPTPVTLDKISVATRTWRDVITDVACGAGGARVWVAPFETYAGQPEAQLALMTGATAPTMHARAWLNATPRLPELRDLAGPDCALPDGEGRWRPFSESQAAALREAYADDMMWLASGADGLARLLNDTSDSRAGQHPPETDRTRGRHDDSQERRMARAR